MHSSCVYISLHRSGQDLRRKAHQDTQEVYRQTHHTGKPPDYLNYFVNLCVENCSSLSQRGTVELGVYMLTDASVDGCARDRFIIDMVFKAERI